MSQPWPLVRLGDVVQHRKQFVRIDDLTEYKRCRVQLHAQGIVLRDRVPGAEIKTKTQQVCRSGDFLVAEIDAKVGGFGIVPQALDGAIVSSHYFLFEINDRELDRSFLDWYCKTPKFSEQVSAQGTTNYAAIRPSHVLGYSIPLPPLAEQRRLVAWLDALASKVEEAKGLSAEAATRHDALFMSQIDRLFTPRVGWTTRSVEELCGDPQYGFTESASLDAVGPRFLRITDIQDGRVRWNAVPFCRCPDPTPYSLRPGDIVFARTGATTGKSFFIHECPEAVFASYLIRLRVRDFVSPEYLYWYFQTPSYWQQIARGSVGTGQANVNGTKLRAIRVPVAPPSAQSDLVAQVRELQALTRTAKEIAAQALARINALVPSALDRAFAGGI